MGKYNIYDNEELINTIIGNEDFISQYCKENNYTYQKKEEIDFSLLEKIKREKEEELSIICNNTIISGIDVETTQGIEHFSLQETDQINLTTAYNAVMSGATQYPYHADGKLCRMFTSAEINAISSASIQHKLYHTTLCNHLLTWVRRTNTEEELNNIYYNFDILPEDLAQNMNQILTNSQNI